MAGPVPSVVHRSTDRTMNTVLAAPVPERPPASLPRLRRAVALIVPGLPLEPSLRRELAELEHQGQAVILVPLARSKASGRDEGAASPARRVLHPPFLGPDALGALLRTARTRPWRLLLVLLRLVAACIRSPRTLLRTLFLLPRATWMAERLAAEGVRHLHAHSLAAPATVALLAAELAGATFSLVADPREVVGDHGLLRWKLGKAVFVRAVSEFTADYLRKHFREPTAGKLQVIPVGAEVRDDEAYPEPPPAHEGMSLLCVAAFEAYSGLPVLVQACRRLRRQGVSFTCRVVGDGPLRAETEKLVAEAKLDGIVELLGARPDEEVRRLMAAAHVVVQPSVAAPDGRLEGIPAALVDAMAMGRTVAASTLGGIPELVQTNRTGWLVRPGDPAALVDALLHILWDPAEAAARARAGREHVRTAFSLTSSAAALVEELDRHDAPLPQDIARVLAPLGAQAGRVALGGVREGRDARVLEVLLPAEQGGGRVVMKVAQAGSALDGAPAERARAEFEALETLAALEDPACRVPRPLGLDEEAGAVLMECCTGERLDDLVSRTRASRNPREREGAREALRATGHWLRRFHAREQAWGDQGDLVEVLVHRMLGDLDAVPPRVLGRGGSQAVRASLMPLIRRVGKRRTTAVKLHGDFRPGKVFVDGVGPQVIDFEGLRRGLPGEDVAWFLVHLEMGFLAPGMRNRRMDATAAFMAGYAPLGVDDGGAFRLCLAAAALALLRDGEVLDAPRLARRARIRHLRGMLPGRP